MIRIMLKKEMRKKADERNGVRKSKERIEEVMEDNIRGNVFYVNLPI